MPSLSLATGLLSQFDAAWTPNTTPDRAATKPQVMVLSPDRVIVGGVTGGVGRGCAIGRELLGGRKSGNRVKKNQLLRLQ